MPVVVLLCNPDVATAEEVVRRIAPYGLQLLCGESPDLVRTLKSRLPCRIWKSVHVPPVAGQASPREYQDAGADALLIDTAQAEKGFVRMGGTGKVGDWSAARHIIEFVSIPVFLAGGINPENVARAVLEVRPYGIDLCSGVEAGKGRKDPAKLRALVANFRAAAATLEESGQ